MSINLLDEHWLPIRRANGSKDHIAPWQLTADHDHNPVVALDAPRPDFNGALVQFLVGLLQTAFAPGSRDEWEDRFFDAPPSPEALKAAFARYQDAFNLNGDGRRFMQDLDPLAGQKPLPITALLIDTAGSETHFIKDLPQQGISPALAAMALYALQTNAPSGGAGHRTSLRGGGPLTTLVLAEPIGADKAATLWQTLWLNVLDAADFRSEHLLPEDIFPWLAPTRASEKGSKTEKTAPESVNPLQMFWGMPRRIRLDFEDVGQGECGLSGEACTALVKQYRTKNYGVNYSGAWEHTLSPHTREGATGEPLPMHPKGAIRYRHWLGLVQQNQDKKVQRIPAATVRRFWNHGLHREGYRFRVWAFGYDMDNMKPRCWHEATMPLYALSESKREPFENAVRRMVDAAALFLGNLRSCLKDAWFSDGDPRRSGADTGFLDTAFWSDTETGFYQALDGLAEAPGDDERRKQAFLDWHGKLHRYTLDAFDRHANTAQITEQNPRRIAEARRDLMRFNHKKDIKALLDLPLKPTVQQ
jgi:CRISPR system Cascade subunit CasA